LPNKQYCNTRKLVGNRNSVYAIGPPSVKDKKNSIHVVFLKKHDTPVFCLFLFLY